MEQIWISHGERGCPLSFSAVNNVLKSFFFQCDPALLPEPNHVMLNHLYALSIKVLFHRSAFAVMSDLKIYSKVFITFILIHVLFILNYIGSTCTVKRPMYHLLFLCSGRRDGSQCYPPIQEEIRHLFTVQAHLVFCPRSGRHVCIICNHTSAAIALKKKIKKSSLQKCYRPLLWAHVTCSGIIMVVLCFIVKDQEPLTQSEQNLAD